MQHTMKQFLKTHGLTQAQAASIFGWDQGSWSRWENAKRFCPPYVLKAWQFFHAMPKKYQREEIKRAKGGE